MMSIDPGTLDADPFRQFDAWLTDAAGAAPDTDEPMVFALATASADASPSVRMVLLRGHGPDGFRFYTDRRSRKGRDIGENPRAAATFHWPWLSRQVRLYGRIEAIGPGPSAEYWATRPSGSRLSALASRQGEPISSREELEARVAQLAAEDPDGQAPLPPYWGGYRLVPDGFEFWISRPDRLHDRVEYRRTFDGGWERRRLQP